MGDFELLFCHGISLQDQECGDLILTTAKSSIYSTKPIAKRVLSKGLVKTRGQAAKEAKELQVEIDRLKTELEAYKLKEERWLRRWQQIAFHIRQIGIQMINVDKTPQEGTMLPSHTVTAQILKPFDKEIPPSGRL